MDCDKHCDRLCNVVQYAGTVLGHTLRTVGRHMSEGSYNSYKVWLNAHLLLKIGWLVRADVRGGFIPHLLLLWSELTAFTDLPSCDVICLEIRSCFTRLSRWIIEKWPVHSVGTCPCKLNLTGLVWNIGDMSDGRQNKRQMLAHCSYSCNQPTVSHISAIIQ